MDSIACAQAGVANNTSKRTVLEALRTVDSTNLKELEWVQAFLEKQVTEGKANSVAYCILAIAKYRLHEFDECMRLMELCSAQDSSLRTTTGKFKLLCAINADDGELASKLFQSLVDASQRESTPIPVRKSYCEWIGEIVGTVDFPEAVSPIEPELLTKAKKSILGMAETALSQAYQDQYKLAHGRAERSRDAISRYTALGDDGAKEWVATRLTEIQKMDTDLVQLTDQAREASEADKTAIKELKSEIANVRSAIQAIEVQWAQVTPGMPVPVAQPFPPRLDLIYVELYQFRFVTEYRNGNPTTYQIQERRPTWDVESQRNAIYQSQLSLYNSQLSIYTQYQKNLAEWRKKDDVRRQELLAQRQQLEAGAAQLRAQLEVLNDAKKDHVGGANELKKLIADAKQEMRAMQDVLRAAEQGKPQLVLRTTNIDPWLITEEKKRILQRLEKPL